ncbi:phosphoglycerate mutase-like protein, partial [Mycena maculata]
GYFAQDDPLADPAVIGAAPARFGLLDSSDTRWSNTMTALCDLNASAIHSTSYKLVLFARHGEGYHNVAYEKKYTRKQWNESVSYLSGLIPAHFGPDPELTALGKEQAAAVNKVWKEELTAGIPLPQKMYCSPMTRALDTYMITFRGISSMRPLVVELPQNCREVYGRSSCDKRRTRTHITTAFPQVDIEKGFKEDDELWINERESVEHVAARVLTVLDRIFRDDKDAIFVSITAHAGIINVFLHTLGRPLYPLPTGGMVSSLNRCALN